MQVIQILASAIVYGMSEDEAVRYAAEEMQRQYEEQQAQYEDLVGDDFTDFGNFNV